MTEATERFFATVPTRAPEVLRARVSGTLEIALATGGGQTEHWLVRLRPGEAEVSREQGPADAVWYCSQQLFDRLIVGHGQAIAAMMRNESSVSGNVMLFLVFRRFLPSPPGTRDPREVAREHVGRPR